MSIKISKKTFLFWLTSLCLIVLTLPIINLFQTSWTLKTLNQKKLFSTDIIESHYNYWLYQIGISGNQKKIIIGKQGWLFLGDQFKHILSKTRGEALLSTNNKRMMQSIHSLKQKQHWLATKKIHSLFVIAPNKYSIQNKFHPDWLQLPLINSTDRFTQKAHDNNVHLLDLRKTLNTAKQQQEILYYKTDTHWNDLASFIAYQEIIIKLNQQLKKITNLTLKKVEIIQSQFKTRRSGDQAGILKIRDILPINYDIGYKIMFNGSQDIVCLHKIKSTTFMIEKTCQPIKNRGQGINHDPKLIINKNALNKQSLLWLRDSFGTANSIFFQKTFHTVWQFHYNKLSGQALQKFIQQHQPDFVLYQVVERNIYSPKLKIKFN
jgi:hypothetical protein